MKNKILIILLIPILFYNFTRYSNIISNSFEKQLIKHLEIKNNCDYFYSTTIFTKVQGSSNVTTCYLKIDKCSELIEFVKSNKKSAIPYLIKYLSDEKYDWISNLLLYEITETPAYDMKLFAPNNCVKWRKMQKDEDVIFWKKKLKM